MKHGKLQTRFFLMNGVSAAGMVILAAMAFVGISLQAGLFEELHGHRMVIASDLEEINASVLTIQANLFRMVTMSSVGGFDAARITELGKQQLVALAAAAKSVAELEKSPDLSSDELKATTDLDAKLIDYGKDAKDAVDYIAFDPGMAATSMIAADGRYQLVYADLKRLLSLEDALNTNLARRGKAQSTMIYAATLAIIVAVLAVMSLLAFLLARGIVSRVRSIALTIDEASTGNLAIRAAIKGDDEIAGMAERFNVLLESLGSMLSTVRDKIVLLSTSGSGLASSIGETASSVAQIHANIESTRNEVAKQSECLEDTASIIEEMARNIESLDGSIELQAAAVSESVSSIEVMVASLRSISSITTDAESHMSGLRGASDDGKQTINTAVQTIRRVSASSDNLEQATTVVSGIARQTNLLAMNAAIEAAHAGEAGKGFAVVADEIRKLAQSAANQAKGIARDLRAARDLIASVDENSGRTTIAFETVSNAVSQVATLIERINNAVSEQNAGSEHIIDALRLMRDVTSSVKSGSSEMTVGNKRLLETLRSLTDISTEIRGAIVEIAAGTEDISLSVATINELGKRNREAIAEIEQGINRFRIDAQPLAGGYSARS